MREILFRGKRKGSGDWLCGDLRQWSEKRKGICDYQQKRTIDVYPETVGQFTGMVDKNGTRIFDGDICRVRNGEDELIGCVDYDNRAALYIVKFGNHKCLLFLDFFLMHDHPNVWCEVIGNIHDNPELLEG